MYVCACVLKCCALSCDRRLEWPSRDEAPKGRLHLQASSDYETLYEYLERLLCSSREWVDAWKMEFWQIASHPGPLSSLRPDLLYVTRHPKTRCVVWGWNFRPVAGPANDWSALVDELGEGIVDIAIADGVAGEVLGEDPGDPDGGLSDSASEDGIFSGAEEGAEDDLFGADSASGAEDDLLAAFSDSFSDGDPPVPPAPPAGGVAFAGAVHAPGAAVLEVPPPPVPMEVEEPPAAAPGPEIAAGGREAAHLTKDVEGGYITVYLADNRMVAHCRRHGPRECRLTRGLQASAAAGRRAQGRPLGLLLAWLRCCDQFDDAAEHKGHRPFPNHEDRLAARTAFAAEADAEAWLACERPRREGEGLEPEAVP